MEKPCGHPVLRTHFDWMIMAKNKAPKKKYKPKARILNIVQVVADRQKLLCEYDPDHVRRISIRDHSALTSLIQGVATPMEMNMLAAAFNMALAMWKVLKLKGEAHEWMFSTLARSGAAFNDLCARGKEVGRITVKAPEMQAMNDLIELSDNLLEIVTVGQFEEAMKLASKTCGSGLTLDQALRS